MTKIKKNISANKFQRWNKGTKRTTRKKTGKTRTTKKVYSNDIIPTITYNTLKEGMVLLGSISEVTNYNLSVCLPFRKIGFVPISYICKEYSRLIADVIDNEIVDKPFQTLNEMFHIGQFINVKIVGIENNQETFHRVNLSIDPNDVNKVLHGTALHEGFVIQCSVIGTNENGYLMDTGIPSVHGAFLAKEYAPYEFYIGSVVLCCIISIENVEDEYTNLQLSAQPELLAEARLTDGKKIAKLHSPGVSVNIKVKKVMPEGLQVECGKIEGIIAKEHIRPSKPEDFTVGSKIAARVLCTTLSIIKPIVHYSLLQNVCNLGYSKKSIKILAKGKKIDDAVVFTCNNSEAIFTIKDRYYAMCSSNHFEKNKSGKPRLLAKGSKVQCRILKYWPMDNIYIVTIKDPDLNKTRYCLRDLTPGDKVTAKIQEVKENGAVIFIGNSTKGFVPSIHLKNPSDENSPAIGDCMQARLLTFKGENSAFFTLRKELVYNDFPIVKQFTEKHIDKTFAGIISGIKENGMYVGFFNGATGFLPISNMPNAKKLDDYSEGDCVPVKVVKLWSNMKAQLSIDFDVNMNEPSNKDESEEENLQLKLIKRKNKPTDETEHVSPTKRTKKRKRTITNSSTENEIAVKKKNISKVRDNKLKKTKSKKLNKNSGEVNGINTTSVEKNISKKNGKKVIHSVKAIKMKPIKKKIISQKKNKKVAIQ